MSFFISTKVSKVTNLISNARSEGFRSVGLPNSKSHFFHFFSLVFMFFTFFVFMTLKWKTWLFEVFTTASWTASAISKWQFIACHTKAYYAEKKLGCCCTACRLKWPDFFQPALIWRQICTQQIVLSLHIKYAIILATPSPQKNTPTNSKGLIRGY